MRIISSLSALSLAFALLFPCVAGAEALRATLLLEDAEDSPWTKMLRDGMQRAAQKHGISTTVRIAPAGPEQRRIFREAAGESDIVLLASEGLHEALRDEAGNFRRKRFGCIDTGIRAKNIMSVSFADEKATFLAGACAAMLSKGKNVPGNALGWLMGRDGPVMRNLINGFIQGARLIDPTIMIHVAGAGAPADAQAAKAACRQLLTEGCGVIMLAAGAANGYAKEALKDSGCLLMAMDRGRDALDEGYAGAVFKRADLAVAGILEAAASGSFKGSSVENRTLASGDVGFAGPPADMATQEISRRLGEIARELENGGIHLKSLRLRTLCDDSCFR